MWIPENNFDISAILYLSVWPTKLPRLSAFWKRTCRIKCASQRPHQCTMLYSLKRNALGFCWNIAGCTFPLAIDYFRIQDHFFSAFFLTFSTLACAHLNITLLALQGQIVSWWCTKRQWYLIINAISDIGWLFYNEVDFREHKQAIWFISSKSLIKHGWQYKTQMRYILSSEN